MNKLKSNAVSNIRSHKRWYELKHHQGQHDLEYDDIRFKICAAGRRCLARGTLVKTPDGDVRIEDLNKGDYVIGYNVSTGTSSVTKVTNTFYNGKQRVYSLLDRNRKVMARATINHRFLACNLAILGNNKFTPTPISYLDVNRVVRRDGHEDIVLTNGKAKILPTYDITVGNEDNLYVLANGIVTHNSGKTEIAKRYMSKLAMRLPNETYFLAAPTRQQAKKIFWEDIKLMTYSHLHAKSPSETDLIVFMPNGTNIHVVGLDNPSRIEGQIWSGCIIDEIADVKDGAWFLNIRPALDTFNPTRPDYLAWAWLIGVPDGFANDFFRLNESAKSKDDWINYAWHSSTVLPKEVVDAARRDMSARQFRQEYMGEFSTSSGIIYEDYGDDNLTDRTIQPHEQICWFHDQNYTPLSSGIGIMEKGEVYLLDEIILESAVSRQSALEFISKYENHENKHVLLYGDPSGRNGEKHGHVSDYLEIEGVLEDNGWLVERRIRKAHPAIKDRQNTVRKLIKNALGAVRLHVNKELAPYCHNGLLTVQLLKGSSYQEDQRNEYQHITTAIGYWLEYEFSVSQNLPKKINVRLY